VTFSEELTDVRPGQDDDIRTAQEYTLFPGWRVGFHSGRQIRRDEQGGLLGDDPSISRSMGGTGNFHLAIANSLRNDQFRPRNAADGEFVEFGIRFVAVDRYDGTNRSHVVASV
jgi:hypothetical protein